MTLRGALRRLRQVERRRKVERLRRLWRTLTVVVALVLWNAVLFALGVYYRAAFFGAP